VSFHNKIEKVPVSASYIILVLYLQAVIFFFLSQLAQAGKANMYMYIKGKKKEREISST